MIEVRKAVASDIDFIAALEKETFSLPEKREDFLKMLSGGDKILLAATYDGAPAGYICAYTVCRESDILTVAVVPGFRKKGIGNALLGALESALRGESDVIFLEVRKSNAAARQLYLTNGFCEIGVRKNYYRLPAEDAVLYKKKL